MSSAPIDGGYVCCIHTHASPPLHSPLVIERKGMGAGIKLMSKERKRTDLETTERLGYTKQEWWPRILTAFSSLVLLSPEVHLQLLPISSEKLPIDFQENVLFCFFLFRLGPVGFCYFKWKFLTNICFIKVCLLICVQSWIFQLIKLERKSQEWVVLVWAYSEILQSLPLKQELLLNRTRKPI